ncbi:MAG TPA: hypothetical protein VES88_15725 [Gemmatimonadaceae bacterium]|nr:hypothetical protein [Gemmatimonadaceae bacterium]
MRDLGQFLRALWGQWKVLLTGGGLMAIVAIFAFATGKEIPRPWGWLTLGFTFVAASFTAWRKERSEKTALETESKSRKRVSFLVEEVRPTWNGDRADFYVQALIINPGQSTMSFKREWVLDIQDAAGKSLERLNGGVPMGTPPVVKEAEQHPVGLSFHGIEGRFDAASLAGATYVVSGEDLLGEPITATYKSSTTS